jgi:hypothetical protein
MTARRHTPHPGQEPASERVPAPVAARAASIDAAQARPLTWFAVALAAELLVRAGYAVLAILAYRIASYWLPLLAGPPAYLLFRHRYGRPVFRRATPGLQGQPPLGEAVSP